ncbi:putative competence protein ComX1 [Streptococcus dysgalactiae subsp. equisimilis AC-2713]|uniref:Competence protein ComX1 n=1 Tax=Streptococcus dysgalactiae subsp. equisimilis AC-2713 TaxID=759913 RepID=A0AB33R566_STREQ|nr:hypothetical protein [Streptococcus dysgalactiae]CCI61877.1 putative competence protein ComX1 [Streptococcus dysgalactiae subsp. equisimilis AC-2713]
MSLETGEVFEKVKPIILKLKRHYYLQLWETDDWLQGGAFGFSVSCWNVTQS